MALRKLKNWVRKIEDLTQPDGVVWCDGSERERAQIIDLLVGQGTLVPLNNELRPNSYIARTDPRDVARVEERTFICSAKHDNAGPTNNWMSPQDMRAIMDWKFRGAMRGRTLYVIPFSMGPIGSKAARYGIEITDSPYVVASMHIMTQVSSRVLDEISNGANWVPAVHSVGRPILPGFEPKGLDATWPCNPDSVYVAHFPESREIWSFGSGYGGNSLLGKKAMSLRIGSVQGRDEGWLAEHMLLIKVTSPEGKSYNISAAFPSACGKTNLAMLQPSLPGWKVETIGDDIVWIFQGEDGTMRAINPEAGLFGVAPGTSETTNSVAIKTIAKDTIFTNVATTKDGDVWWEGLTENPPAGLTNWKGKPHRSDTGPAAHPNSRFCVSIQNAPSFAPEWSDPSGVKLDAILFGGRRATNVPLVVAARSWEHGVFMGATMASEQTAAAEGPVGVLRRDPFAMLPFCGYNMADYWQHWLNFGAQIDADKRPKIFQVNWFRKSATGKFLWPGFSENSRVIDWIISNLEGKAPGKESGIGMLPEPDEFNLSGLDITSEERESLFEVDAESWLHELDLIDSYFDSFGSKLPGQLREVLQENHKNLEGMISGS